ncbi:proton-conducting transporter transmembrane domain-containing protein [Aporhodopirellula aestuarii]|uniref:Oxidoreductase n=1 Tax=Aporhodopirellula aestuarii TaxID=2950107 RepID=A0ABT0TXN0_9BACT|nr:proton-conducting transporter membrane subunit [Aporhodopirellula aestuarii]MCM2369359.1 oxidoreductase [Aporhodopirellula aestuarii]
MPELHFPWIEISILVPMIGALWVHMFGDRENILTHAIVICVATLLLTIGELLDFLYMDTFEAHDHGRLLSWIFNPRFFVIDELSAFLIPLSALIFLVVVMSTLRTKAPRFSLKLALISETLVLATFSCRASWALIWLLISATIPPYIELKQRKRCTRIYALHMGVFAVLLIAGYAWQSLVDVGSTAGLIAGALLTAAALLRAGIFPLHLWMTDLFEKGTFGTAILFTTPLVGAYAVMRLVLPIAPSWGLQSIAVLSLITAVYAGSMALVQQEARRMFCFLLLSQSSLVLVGLELVTPIGLAGALCVWLSVGLSLTGFGITLRSIEARISRVSLADYHGMYRQMPMMAGFFLLTGLAAIGFPATVGFVGMELLVQGAVDIYPMVGTLVVLAAALCGITVLMTYFRIFTGHGNRTMVPMNARPTERFAVLMLTLLIVGGGLVPQPGVASRYHAAKELTNQRTRLLGPEDAGEHSVDEADAIVVETE